MRMKTIIGNKWSAVCQGGVTPAAVRTLPKRTCAPRIRSFIVMAFIKVLYVRVSVCMCVMQLLSFLIQQLFMLLNTCEAYLSL